MLRKVSNDVKLQRSTSYLLWSSTQETMNPIEFLAHPYAVVLARWLLAGIFLVAGISKLLDREGSVEAVKSYQIVPQRFARWFALPVVFRNCCGICVASGFVDTPSRNPRDGSTCMFHDCHHSQLGAWARFGLSFSFSEQDLNGRLVTLGVDRRRPSLLVFISPDCSACANVPAAIRTLYGHEKDHLDLVVVSLSGDQVKNHVYAEKQKLDGIPYVASPGLAEKYAVSATPYAILVDAQGTVQTKGVVNNLEHMEGLLNAHNGRLVQARLQPSQ